LGLGFEDLMLHHTHAECHPENRTSYRLMVKVEMRREGHLRASHWDYNEWWDVLAYAILDHD
jgi:RimJ/RimL family protein N-acetyltransferase